VATPYGDRVTGLDLSLLREIAAALLIMAGLIALVVIAFKVDPMLGFTTLSVYAIATGFALALAPRSRG
jgi:hypothetical protein